MLRTISCFFGIIFSAAHGWNYVENSAKGPSKWGDIYPKCLGSSQSPIDIRQEHIRFSTHLLSFELPGYDSIPSGAHWELHNNGHLLQIQLSGEYMVSEGGLNGQYKAMQMDFRWGRDDKKGSEHALNGTKFPMELQIVHYNTKYGSYDEALMHDDGLAIFAFLFKEKSKEVDNPIFSQIIKNLPNIKYKGQYVILRPVPLLSMLPINLNDYYRYEGSLSHPPCSEIVSWTIFNEVIEISKRQMSLFKNSLYINGKSVNEVDERLVESSRTLQHINDRLVYSSMIKDATIWTAPLSPISITLAVLIGFIILFIILGRQQKLDDDLEMYDNVVTSPVPSTATSVTSSLDHHLD